MSRRWPWSRNAPTELTAAAGLRATAAVGRIADAGLAPSLKRKTQEWQGEAYDHVDTIGPLGAAVDYDANACSKVRVFPAIQLEPDAPPVPIDAENTGVPGPVIESALACWAAYRDRDGGQAELIRAHAKHLLVAGELYMLGFEPDENDPLAEETWQIRSVDEIRTLGSGAYQRTEIRDSVADRWRPLPDSAYIHRALTPHDRFHGVADSPLRRLLPDCDEYVTLSLAALAIGRSQIPPGAILWPSGLSMPGVPGAANATEKPERQLQDSMTRALTDPGDIAAFMPPLIMGDKAELDAFKFVSFGRPLSDGEAAARVAAFKRMAQGGPWPPEIFLGIGDTNHWNAAAITAAMYDQFMDPLMLRVMATQAAGYLRPRMLADGQPPAWIKRVCLWFDASGVTSDPQQAENVLKAYDRVLISGRAARRGLDISDEDAPKPEEEAARRANPLATDLTGRRLAPELAMTASASPTDVALSPLVHASLTASASRLSFAKLRAAIDSGLRDRLRMQADGFLERGVELAGARARRAVARDGAAAAAVAGQPNASVTRILGRAVVTAAIGDDALTAGAFDGLRPKFDAGVTAAQTATLRTMASELEADYDDLEAETADDFAAARSEAWTWLEATLTALLLTRLYDPHPQAPALGEVDPSVSVPPSLIREAVARAGGENVTRDGLAVVTAAGDPVGGVAVGHIVADVFREHGQVVANFGWDYGDPSTRKSEFPPHAALDGAEFATWQDDILANPEAFPEGTHLFPGDHDGCMCGVVAVFGSADDLAASGARRN